MVVIDKRLGRHFVFNVVNSENKWLEFFQVVCAVSEVVDSIKELAF